MTRVQLYWTCNLSSVILNTKPDVDLIAFKITEAKGHTFVSANALKTLPYKNKKDMELAQVATAHWTCGLSSVILISKPGWDRDDRSKRSHAHASKNMTHKLVHAHTNKKYALKHTHLCHTHTHTHPHLCHVHVHLITIEISVVRRCDRQVEAEGRVGQDAHPVCVQGVCVWVCVGVRACSGYRNVE